jgi:hypothetical protein
VQISSASAFDQLPAKTIGFNSIFIRCLLNNKLSYNKMAGGEGLEPSYAGSKFPCLASLANPQFFFNLFLSI